MNFRVRITLLLALSMLIQFSCTREDEYDDLVEFSGLSAIELKLNELLLNDRLNNSDSFATNYGVVDFENVVSLDESDQSKLFRVIKEGVVQHWMTGYYNDEGEIEFRIKELDEIETYTLGSEEKRIYGSQIIISELKVERVFSSSNQLSANCYTENRYRTVCGYYDANNNGQWDQGVDGDLQCRDVYVGTTVHCSNTSTNEYNENLNLNGGGGWLAPFDPTTDLPCPGNPIKRPRVAPQTHSGIMGGMYGLTRSGGTQEHNGLDLKSEFGSPVYAMYDGTASTYYQESGAGYFTSINSVIDGNDVSILYFHLQPFNRISGSVKAGDIIGYLGDSGNLKNALDQNLSVSHLHIKVKVNGQSVDPRTYLTTEIDDDGDVNMETDC